MKKNLFLLAFVLMSLFSFSQLVTISGENQIPQIGQEIVYNNINVFGFNLAGTPDGINTIWDFSSLTITDQVTFSYTDATTEPATSDFPDATIAEAISGTEGLMYFKTDNYFMARKGATGSMYLNYNLDSALLLSFPITAGENIENSYTGVLSAQNLDMEIDNGHVEINADAQGTITLPNGTVLTDVLRVHVVENFRGMYDMGFGPTEVITINDNFYYWFHEDYTNPIFVYGTTTVGGLSSDETESLRFQPIVISDTEEESVSTNLIYPNPSNGTLNILESESYDIGRVLNIYGKEVKTFVPSSTIGISDLSNGVYFIVLNGTKGKNVSKIVLEK
ncbi:MAG: T9SS type A sorting domain-containing protein [Bacteroidales bacterium]|nr:T9SS type A sorting domain-containing protein [Bacteroidales bacterium]